MVQAPPLRFLALVVGGWIGARAALLMPPTAAEAESSPPAPIRTAARTPQWLPERIAAAHSRPGPGIAPSRLTAPPLPPRHKRGETVADAPRAASPPVLDPPAPGHLARLILPVAPALSVPTPLAHPAPFPAPRAAAFPPGSDRWSLSVWMFGRRGGQDALAPGGILGASQAGLRILYRIAGPADRPLALSGRLSAPLARPRAGEAALGLEWRPLPDLPVAVLAERRQALGDEGRSAFALTLHGGVAEQPVAGALHLDGYAQAGLVGLAARDPFVDGGARLTMPAGRAAFGLGAWGAAQPGVERLDAGPTLSLRLPGPNGAGIRVTADWRFRLLGDARPASGPALTVSGGF